MCDRKFVICADDSTFKCCFCFECKLKKVHILFIGMHTCVEGSKRQLPPWMMQKVGATATHVSDSNNAVETNCYIKKGDIIKTNATKKDHKS